MFSCTKSAHCLEELKVEFTVRSCLYFSFLLLLNQNILIPEPAPEEMTVHITTAYQAGFKYWLLGTS